MSKESYFKSNRGQSIIEVVVAIGIAVVIIGSLVTLANAGSRRATLARQANQASSLAQEGMEIVRNIRDSDALGAVRVGLKSGILCSSLGPTFCNWSDLYTSRQTSVIAYLSSCVENCLISTAEPAIQGVFNREVTIEDGAAGVASCPPDLLNPGNPILDWQSSKKVTVRVTWNSPIGSQERKVVSCLTNWKKT